MFLLGRRRLQRTMFFLESVASVVAAWILLLFLDVGFSLLFRFSANFTAFGPEAGLTLVR